MQIDALADEMMRAAMACAEGAVAPLRAENAALRAALDGLTARLADVEAREPVPGPQGPQGEPGRDGRDGIDGKDGAPGAAGKDGIDGKDGRDGIDGRDGVDGKDGSPGPQGERGPQGMLPQVRAWEDRVHYAAECVTHNGATWQAVKDTGHAPPHGDWVCIAARGADGLGITARGTWTEGEEYQRNDIVALGGGSWIALSDNPGTCPGPLWQLLASQGKRGQMGKVGERGPRGERGEPGPAFIAGERRGGSIVFTDDRGDQITVELSE